MSTIETPPGSAFEYDAESEAVIVREGDLLVWSEFGERGWRRLRSPFGAVGGDWRVWTVLDTALDDALVVKAEMIAWPTTVAHTGGSGE